MPTLNERPPIINQIIVPERPATSLIFATGNRKKQEEIQRILGDTVLFVEGLKYDEIQGSPHEVAAAKAKAAWEANGYNPVFVEDISLHIHGQEDTYIPTEVKVWAHDRKSRAKVCKKIKKDRSATALAIYAMYDGQEVHIFEGFTHGKIAKKPKGPDLFGWDDIFIPDGDSRTFAKMSVAEKDAYSMRRKALENILKKPPQIGFFVNGMPEPFANELARIRPKELQKQTALSFAFDVDALRGNSVNNTFDAPHYLPVHAIQARKNEAVFYTRYTINPNSPNLGLIETDFIRNHIKRSQNGDPIIWQLGPQRRALGLAQRAEFFLENQNKRVHTLLDELEKTDPPRRSNKRHIAIEQALGAIHTDAGEIYPNTEPLESIGYGKVSADKRVSRQPKNNEELFHKIGKYYRRIIGLGSMPPTTGSADVLATTALGHMLSFIPRNSIYADNLDLQIKLYQHAVEKITHLNIPKKWKERALRNIGASLGTDDPDQVLQEAEQLYNAGIRLFRIYTINSDPRVVETAKKLRQRFGDDIEIFVGQLPDKKIAKKLIEEDIRVDALLFGHGGGQQCDSAGNGMAVKTLEEIYSILTDPIFNDTCVGIEGSSGRNIGTYLTMGVDFILYNQRIVRSGIEDPAGDLYFEHINSTPEKRIFVQPYPGSASSETMTIEAMKESLTKKRISASGRTRGPEGASGLKRFRNRAAGSIVFWINSLLYDAGKALADFGVSSVRELRQVELDNHMSRLKYISPRSQQVGSIHGEK